MPNVNTVTGAPVVNTVWGDGEGGKPINGTTSASTTTPLTDGQVAEMVAMNKMAGIAPTRANGVLNADGSPVLAEGSEFSAEDMTDFIRVWTTKTQDQQLNTNKQKVQGDQLKKQDNNEAQMEKLQEWADKCAEAKNQSTVSKIFGWIAKVFAVIASAVFMVVAAGLTGLTGGLGAPVMALATMAMIGSTMALADQISKEFGGPEISLSNMLTTLVGKTLEACGVDPETATRIGKVVAGAVAILLPAALVVEPSILGDMATGIAELSGADANTVALTGMIVGMVAALTVGIVSGVMSGGSTAVNTATKITLTIVNVSNAVVQGSMGIGKGVNDLKVAGTQEDAELAKAANEKLIAFSIQLQAAMDEGLEQMKKILKSIDDAMVLVSQVINGQADSKSQIAANISSRVTI
ncbi:type III secretion system translocon subunit SctE [Achromobacter marplatensis]|uniref:type III secretion system translocon subunit SctE n=1 Tax=Achromobacter marplatensis TaxID=470868 RepID=UPI0039F68BBB